MCPQLVSESSGLLTYFAKCTKHLAESRSQPVDRPFSRLSLTGWGQSFSMQCNLEGVTFNLQRKHTLQLEPFFVGPLGSKAYGGTRAWPLLPMV